MGVPVKNFVDICRTRKHSSFFSYVRKTAEFSVRYNVKVVPSVARQSQVWRDKWWSIENTWSDVTLLPKSRTIRLNARLCICSAEPFPNTFPRNILFGRMLCILTSTSKSEKCKFTLCFMDMKVNVCHPRWKTTLLLRGLKMGTEKNICA
jgi:hypothetical protein